MGGGVFVDVCMDNNAEFMRIVSCLTGQTDLFNVNTNTIWQYGKCACGWITFILSLSSMGWDIRQKNGMQHEIVFVCSMVVDPMGKPFMLNGVFR